MLKNLVLFKAGWVVCVMSAAQGAARVGGAIVMEHMRSVAAPSRELLLLLAAGVVGLIWESMLVNLDLLRYEAGMLRAGLGSRTGTMGTRSRRLRARTGLEIGRLPENGQLELTR